MRQDEVRAHGMEASPSGYIDALPILLYSFSMNKDGSSILSEDGYENKIKEPRWPKAPKVTLVALALTLALTATSTANNITLNVVLFVAALGVGGVAFICGIHNAFTADNGGKGVLKFIGTLLIPILGLGTLSFGFNVFGDDANSNAVQSSTTPQNGPVTQEPTAKSILESVGAKVPYDDLSLVWSDDIQKACGGGNSSSTDTAGCYLSDKYSDGTEINKRITLKTPYDGAQIKTNVAHEFLHYAWYKYNLDAEQELNDNLYKIYQANPPLQQRLDTYTDVSGKKQATELFSYGCTEMSDAELGPYVAAACNRYIDTRTLPARY